MGGEGEKRKLSKVALKVNCLPKQEGGLGLLDVNATATKLAAKWICRAFAKNDTWADMIKRHCNDFQLKELKAWVGFLPIEVFLFGHSFIYKGSQLIMSLWEAWNAYRSHLHYKEGPRIISLAMS